MPKKPQAQLPAGANDEAKADPQRDPRRISWAKLLKRVFSIDMETCSRCASEMKIIAAIMETTVVEKILKHVGLPHKPPDIAPARYAGQQPLFET